MHKQIVGTSWEAINVREHYRMKQHELNKSHKHNCRVVAADVPVHRPRLCFGDPLGADTREEPATPHLPGHTLVPAVGAVI